MRLMPSILRAGVLFPPSPHSPPPMLAHMARMACCLRRVTRSPENFDWVPPTDPLPPPPPPGVWRKDKRGIAMDVWLEG